VTDLGELGNRDLNCSMINISSGYHYPHSPNEIVKLDELSVALQLAYECAVELGSKRWAHTPSSSWGADVYYSSGGGSSKKDWRQGYKDELIEELELLGYDMCLHQLDRLSIDQLETLYDERHDLLSGDAAEDGPRQADNPPQPMLVSLRRDIS
jgi:hypothetical protein